MKKPASTYRGDEQGAAAATTTARWYRQRWPWLLIAGPALVVVASIATAWLAVKSDDGLVTDNYYKRGLLINRTLEAARPATADTGTSTQPSNDRGGSRGPPSSR
jgi:hypothetical protein